MLSQVTETHRLKDPKLVIFDLWQTLADTETSLLQSILDILDIKISLEKFVEAINKSDIFLTERSIDDTLPNFLSKFNSTPEQTSEVLEIWKMAPRRSRLYRFSESWVTSIKDRKIPIALLTNIDQFGYEHFIDPDFLELFDYEFLSFREGIAKPNPECFLRTCLRFNVHPTEVVMIGNSDNDDILPARNLGMTTVKIPEKLNLDTTDFSEVNLF